MSKLDSPDATTVTGINEVKGTSVSPEGISLSYEELFDKRKGDEKPCYLPEQEDQDFKSSNKSIEEAYLTHNANDGIVISENVESGECDERYESQIQDLYLNNSTSDFGEETKQSLEHIVSPYNSERKEEAGDDASEESNYGESNPLEEIEQFDEPDKIVTARGFPVTTLLDHKHVSVSPEGTSENGFATTYQSSETFSESDNTLAIMEEITVHEEEASAAKGPMSSDFLTTNLIPGKRHDDEDDGSALWRKHKKHFFILSNAGKPIYSRYGDEHKLAGFSATLQAIISFVDNSGDRIRYIKSGDHQFVFLVKGPIYLVSISATDEPIQVLRRQLELLHGQKCFLKNPNFDLRPLLGGTEGVFSSLIRCLSRNPASFLHSYTCLPLSHTSRQAAGAALQDVANSDLLFSLLLSDTKVISLVGTQKASLHSDDILLLSNFVSSSESFRTTESFSPICLPHYNAMAFLYAYITYLNTDTCLIFITKNSDAFFHLKACRTKVEKFLSEAHVLDDITSSVARGGLRVEELPGDFLYGSLSLTKSTRLSPGTADLSIRRRAGVGGAAGLWHFIYRSVYLDQYVSSEFSSPLHTKQSQKRLFRAYERLYASIHNAPAGQHQMQYRRDENHVLLAWSTGDFEFFAAFDPLAEKSSAIVVCNRVCQWIRDVENEIFFVGASPFNW